jgi:hypothetical protein
MCLGFGWHMLGIFHACAWHSKAHTSHMPGIRLAFAWHMPGICFAYTKHLLGRSNSYAWHMPGRCLAHVWHMSSKCMTRARPMFGHMQSICLAYVSHIRCLCMGHAYAWHIAGLCMAFACQAYAWPVPYRGKYQSHARRLPSMCPAYAWHMVAGNQDVVHNRGSPKSQHPDQSRYFAPVALSTSLRGIRGGDDSGA